jgi:hypothetical protein
MSDADSIDQGWGAGGEAKAVTAARWQVNIGGRRVRAMTDTELLVSYKAGKLTPKSLVWSEGMREWAPLGDVPQVAALIRADSEPPASGTRAVGDEPMAGSKNYTSSGSEPPTSPGTSPGTNPGTIAVYERPLATLVFPDSDEPPESSDEPTPAFGMPSKSAVEASLPEANRREPIPGRTTLVDGVFEPAPLLPPLPPRASSAFPSPVTASPLGAALTSTVTPAAQRPVQSDGYATAKATSPITPKLAARLSTPLPAVQAALRTPLPGTQAAAKLKTPLPTTDGSAPTPQSFPAQPSPGLPVVDKPVTSAPPRPAIEFLPPIIVQEKDDDGASVIELPLEAQLPLDDEQRGAAPVTLHDAPFHESTLVLAGRRPKRWVPLGAAVAAAVGAACLASALTALIVKTRPEPPPRIVEKRVLVPAPAPVVEARALATAAPEPEPEAAATPAKEAKASTSTELRSAKSDATSASVKPSWKREDPGALDATESEPTAAAPRRELRAGFPTNPGF